MPLLRLVGVVASGTMSSLESKHSFIHIDPPIWLVASPATNSKRIQESLHSPEAIVFIFRGSFSVAYHGGVYIGPSSQDGVESYFAHCRLRPFVAVFGIRIPRAPLSARFTTPETRPGLETLTFH